MGSCAFSLVKEEYGFVNDDLVSFTAKLINRSLKDKQREILYYISLD
jgi:hypothetical protein